MVSLLLGGRGLGSWEVGRLVNLPFFIMSFQLAIFPSDSFIALLPAVLSAFIVYNQYFWLSVLLLSSSEVSISNMYLLSEVG